MVAGVTEGLCYGLIRERGGTRPYLGRCEVRASEPLPVIFGAEYPDRETANLR
jgi:hypothetical protein